MEQFIEVQELGLGQASIGADFAGIAAANVSMPFSWFGAQYLRF